MLEYLQLILNYSRGSSERIGTIANFVTIVRATVDSGLHYLVSVVVRSPRPVDRSSSMNDVCQYLVTLWVLTGLTMLSSLWPGRKTTMWSLHPEELKS